MNKKMLIRILTGLLIVACVVPPILLGGIPMECLITFVAVFSAYELASLSDQKPHYIKTALLLAAIEVLIHLDNASLAIGLSMYIVVLFLGHFVKESLGMDEITHVFMITVVLVYAVHGIHRIYDAQGGLGMLYTAFACYFCDTGAYFLGSFFGKHKMIPQISPNKTWEGAVGGYLCGAVVSFLFGYYFCSSLPVELLLCASVLIPAVAEIGDLAFSSVKRHFGLKDFGSLLPGHGGVLDRVDSLVFCLMVMNGLLLVWGF